MLYVIPITSLQAENNIRDQRTQQTTAQLKNLKQQETDLKAHMTEQKRSIVANQKTLQALCQQKQKATDECAALVLQIPELADLTARFVTKCIPLCI